MITVVHADWPSIKRYAASAYRPSAPKPQIMTRLRFPAAGIFVTSRRQSCHNQPESAHSTVLRLVLGARHHVVHGRSHQFDARREIP